jgi:hypothetical protein
LKEKYKIIRFTITKDENQNNLKILFLIELSIESEDLKAVAETGFSLTPPGRVYEIGKGAVDLVDDFKSGNFEKTANNIIDRVVPKGLRRTGVSKTASDKIGDPVSATAFKSSFVLTLDFETYSSFLNTSTPFKFCSGIFIISYLKGLIRQ